MKEFCVDLQLAKELKENGFPQNTLFWWNEGFINKISDYYLCNQKGYIKGNHCSAPFSDEILKELPNEINGFLFRIERTQTNYMIGYFECTGYGDDEVRFGYFHDNKLSNALAKMWLYLKKEGHIK